MFWGDLVRLSLSGPPAVSSFELRRKRKGFRDLAVAGLHPASSLMGLASDQSVAVRRSSRQLI